MVLANGTGITPAAATPGFPSQPRDRAVEQLHAALASQQELLETALQRAKAAESRAAEVEEQAAATERRAAAAEERAAAAEVHVEAVRQQREEAASRMEGLLQGMTVLACQLNDSPASPLSPRRQAAGLRPLAPLFQPPSQHAAPGRCLYVGSLPYLASAADARAGLLRAELERLGAIEALRFGQHVTRKERRWALVCYHSASSAAAALHALHGRMLPGLQGGVLPGLLCGIGCDKPVTGCCLHGRCVLRLQDRAATCAGAVCLPAHRLLWRAPLPPAGTTPLLIEYSRHAFLASSSTGSTRSSAAGAAVPAAPAAAQPRPPPPPPPPPLPLPMPPVASDEQPRAAASPVLREAADAANRCAAAGGQPRADPPPALVEGAGAGGCRRPRRAAMQAASTPLKGTVLQWAGTQRLAAARQPAGTQTQRAATQAAGRLQKRKAGSICWSS